MKTSWKRVKGEYFCPVIQEKESDSESKVREQMGECASENGVLVITEASCEI